MASTSNKEKILTIVTGGICIAMSYVLSLIPLFDMPQGGTVTPASMLPLIVFCMAFGPAWGFAASTVFAALQLIGCYYVTPFQILLDYILGYMAYGIVGFASLRAKKRYEIKSPLTRFCKAGLIRAFVFTVLAYAARCLCSVLSGVIFFAEYAGDMNPWVYSITYNGTFLAVDMAITLVVMIALYGALRKSKFSK